MVKQEKPKKAGKCLRITSYTLNSFIILAGLMVLLIGISTKGSPVVNMIVPDFTQSIAAYLGISGLLIAAMGIWGVYVHRRYVVEKRFNIVLCLYAVIVLIVTIVVLLAGSAAIAIDTVMAEAQNLDFTSSSFNKNSISTALVLFETNAIKTANLTQSSSEDGWIKRQDENHCCGYFDSAFLEKYIDPSVVEMNDGLPTGESCAIGCATRNWRNCVGTGQLWCRDVFLSTSRTYLQYLGGGMLVYGIFQAITLAFTVYYMCVWTPPETIRSPRAKRNSSMAMTAVPPALQQIPQQQQQQQEQPPTQV